LKRWLSGEEKPHKNYLAKRYHLFQGIMSFHMTDTIRITLIKSIIGKNKKIRQTLKGLGLNRLNKTVSLKNTPAIRGMISKVSYMVKVDI
jgi:large subunit ribosomal protein L30